MNFKVLIAAALLGACSAASGATTVADPLPAVESEWVELTPEPVEIDGRVVAATCADVPGADAAYRFWAKRGRSNNLVVFFDGGGACWDDVTCALPRLARDRSDADGFYKGELLPTDNPSRLGGMFDLDNTRNPVRDWSFVFVPYCTGDVHSGSNTAHYTDPDTGEPYTLQHRGADNFRVILEWMRANFGAPDEILVTGSSAGAYGAATHYAAIRAAFPSGRAVMLGDAGQGVTTPDFLERRNDNWNYDLPASVFGADGAVTSDEDVVAILAAHFPQDRFAQYTTAHDITQASFFALMGAQNACRAWTERMASDLTRRQQAGNFRSYLGAGQTHTILRTQLFYTERSGGQPFVDWFAGLLSETPPANDACEHCLTQRVRCPF
ncbi:MAG: pectin acetylesterase-family hydrolase [Hyphomonadaceae bacterium]